VAVFPAFLCGLLRDSPVFICCLSNTLHGTEQIQLAEAKTRDVDRAIVELRQSGRMIGPVLRKSFEAERVCNSLGTLRLGADIDRDIALVEHDEGPLYEIEAEAI
jgi:hypothetical protein